MIAFKELVMWSEGDADKVSLSEIKVALLTFTDVADELERDLKAQGVTQIRRTLLFENTALA